MLEARPPAGALADERLAGGGVDIAESEKSPLAVGDRKGRYAAGACGA